MKMIAKIGVSVHPAWVSKDYDPTLEPDIQEIIMEKLKGNPNLFEGVKFYFIGFEEAEAEIEKGEMK